MTWVKSYCGGKRNYTIGGDMENIEEAYIKQKKTNSDLNEIIYHLRMEIKRLQEIIEKTPNNF